MKSKTVKKLIMFALCVAVITVLCAVVSFADDYGNFTYSKAEDESYITITSVNIDEDDPQCIEIPDYIDDIPVTTIGDNAFKGKNNIGDVIFPETVTTIGSAAFANCDGLKVLVFGQNVKDIGTSAFYECSALETVYFSDSVENIGDIAFKDCDALKNVHFGTGLKSIGKGAFFGCGELKAVVLTGTPEIGDHAIGVFQDGDKVESTGLIISKTAEAFDGEWTNIRVATDTYVGLDMRVNNAGDIELRDNTEIPQVDSESTLISVIVILVLCIAFAIVCVIYIKKEKARRNKAIEDYKKNNK